jgi:hypothetical protein
MGLPGKQFTVQLRGTPERVAVSAVLPDEVVLVTDPADGTWVDSFRCTLNDLGDDIGQRLGVTTVSSSGIRPRGWVIEHADGYGGRSVAMYTAPTLAHAVAFAEDAGLTRCEFVGVWS